MALTKPKIWDLDTNVTFFTDSITVLNQGADNADLDVGFLFNRAHGLVSNVALYWSESQKSFITAFTSNSGTTNSNISVSSYANITVGSLITLNGAGIYLSPGAGFSLDGAFGSVGQVLTATGSGGVQWSPPGGFTGGYVSGLATFGSNLVANSTTTSTSTSTGALVVLGGIGVSGNINSGGYGRYSGIFDEATTTAGIFLGNAGSGVPSPRIGLFNANSAQNWQIDNYYGTFRWFTPGVERMKLDGNTGQLTLPSTVTSTSITTGALVVSGGTGINGNLYVSGNIVSSSSGAITVPVGTTAQRPGLAAQGMVRYNTTISSFEGFGAGAAWSSLGGVKSVDGYAYISAEASAGAGDDVLRFYSGSTGSSVQVMWASGSNVSILPTTVASSTTTGALQVSGGVGIAGNLYVGGNLVVNGTTTTINNTTIETTEYVQTTYAGSIYAATLGNTGASVIGATGQFDTSVTTATVNAATIGNTGATLTGNTLTTDSGATIGGNLVVSGNLNISANGYVNGSKILVQGDLDTVTTVPTLITVDPTSDAGLSAIAGTSTSYGSYQFGNVQSVSILNDYNVSSSYGFYSINDAATTPGYVVYCGFTGVTGFSRLVLNLNYTAASGHTIDIDLYNFTTSTWDTLTTYSGTVNWVQFMLEVIDSSAYISAGKVYSRLYHVNFGNASLPHNTKIDYWVLQDSLQGGQGPRGPTGATGATGPAGTYTGGYIANTTTFGSNVVANSNTPSTSVTTGAIVVVGGVGVSGNVHSGTLTTSTATINGTATATTVNAATIGNVSSAHIGATGRFDTSVTTATLNAATIGNVSSAHIGATGRFDTSVTTATLNAATVGNTGAVLTGTLSTAAQTNVTSLGTLTGLTVSGVTQLTSSTNNNGTQYNSGALQVTGGAGIGGNLWVGGNLFVAGNTTVVNTTVSNSVTGNLIIGLPLNFSALGANVQYGGNQNGYLQMNMQNLSSGSSASTDYVATADNGNDSSNYIDLGINSSTYSQAGYSANYPNDGYVMVQGNGTNVGGNLILATMTARDIVFTTNGQNSDNIVARITSGNVLTVVNTQAATSTTTGAFRVAGGAGIAGALYAGSVYDNGNRVLTSFSSTGTGNLTVSVSNPTSTTIGLPATGPGATSVGSSTAIPVITTDAYGRVAGTSTAAVIAPAGTLSGTTLASGVVSSSLTSLGVITSLSATTAVVTNFSTGNAQITSCDTTNFDATTGVITNFSSGNARITSGYADNYPIGANTKATGAFTTLTATGNVDLQNTVYGRGIYDNANRVVSTSGGLGNLTISASTIYLTAMGPGAASVGSSTAIPVITTDVYGRVAGTTTAAVVAPAGTLTGTTLASGVVSSSLTSLGIITALSATTAVATNFSSGNITGTFNGTLSSSITAATANVAVYDSVTALTTNQTFYPTFSNTSATGNTITGVSSGLSYNPGTGNLVAGQHVSTVATGTPPLYVASTTKVTNLNAELVDGYHADETNTASSLVARNASKNIAVSGVVLSGSTSGTSTLVASAAAGTTTHTLPAVTGTVITTGDTGTVTSTMILDGTIVNGDINASAAIAVSKLAASTISGVTLGSNLNTLTIGTGLSGTSYNGSAAVTITNTGVLSVNGSTGTITGIATTGATLAQFAATTSAQLAGVISDETGSGALVFATSPSLTTPAIGAATGTSLTLTGALQAATKSFLIPHPTKPGKQLRYGSLEGPENGVYVRGRLTGSNTIELPEYWTKLVDPESITVNLTPIGRHQNLYVVEADNTQVIIGNSNLINKGIDCYYTVYGERCDVDKLGVEID